MSGEPPGSEEERPTEGTPTSESESPAPAATETLSDAAVWRSLRLGAIGLLALLALVSTVQLYFNASAAIGRWVSPDFVPVFRGAFNLVVLLLALAGLAVVARRRGSGSLAEGRDE